MSRALIPIQPSKRPVRCRLASASSFPRNSARHHPSLPVPEPANDTTRKKQIPFRLAGGGFRHGQHLPFNPDSLPPLCNLYAKLLQRLGIETDRFGTSTGTLSGLEMNG